VYPIGTLIRIAFNLIDHCSCWALDSGKYLWHCHYGNNHFVTLAPSGLPIAIIVYLGTKFETCYFCAILYIFGKFPLEQGILIFSVGSGLNFFAKKKFSTTMLYINVLATSHNF
jgi:hypothetical protein